MDAAGCHCPRCRDARPRRAVLTGANGEPQSSDQDMHCSPTECLAGLPAVLMRRSHRGSTKHHCVFVNEHAPAGRVWMLTMTPARMRVTSAAAGPVLAVADVAASEVATADPGPDSGFSVSLASLYTRYLRCGSPDNGPVARPSLRQCYLPNALRLSSFHFVQRAVPNGENRLMGTLWAGPVEQLVPPVGEDYEAAPAADSGFAFHWSSIAVVMSAVEV